MYQERLKAQKRSKIGALIQLSKSQIGVRGKIDDYR